MKTPYTFRILAALPGHEPIELFRSSRKYAQADWDAWTRDLDPAWECWTEFTLRDRDTITPRPHLWRKEPTPHVGKNRLAMTLAEIEPLRDSVVQFCP